MSQNATSELIIENRQGRYAGFTTLECPYRGQAGIHRGGNDRLRQILKSQKLYHIE